MSIFDLVMAATEREIDFGAISFRIRKVCSRDLVLHGRPMLAAIPTGNEPGAADAPPDDDDEAARLRRLIDNTLRNPGMVLDQIDMRNAVVCAGVTAGRAPDEDWEPLHLTTDLAAEDGAQKVLWVERLDGDMLARLFAEILTLSASPEVARSLATFRGGSKPGGARGRSRKAIR